MGVGWWVAAMPWIVGTAWIVHAVLSWQRPYRVDAVGWFLLVGLPVAGVAIFVVETRLYPPGDVHPDDALLGPGFDLVWLAGELLLIWWAVLMLECLLAAIRHARFNKAVRRTAA